MATRILVALGDERTNRLDAMAGRRGKSRSALIREAVDRLIDDDPSDWDRRLAAMEAGFGLWAKAGISIDPHDYERRRRAEWTRPWDDDYEEVRAESPDLFDAEDDRQRQIYLDIQAGRHPKPTFVAE